MGGPSRTSGRKAALRSSASQSNGATNADEQVDVAIRTAYATPETAQGSSRPDVSRLSQTLEPLSLSTNNDLNREHTQVVAAPDVGTLGEGVKDLISVMSQLSRLGLDRCDIPLAKCIVCGDQSAGKSSVIEAISGIKVPRSSGTCTRCPMFIQLECSTEDGSGWHAKVSIRKTYQWIPNSKEAGRQKYHSWLPKDSVEEIEFASTRDPTDLANLIGLAQLSVLNPGKPYDQFASCSGMDISSETRAADFSPNVVCIHISGADLPNLSFYDLPGVIIGRGERSKETLKKFIIQLITDYISDPNALVLLTSSLEIDWDVSSHAAELVHKVRATDRCVGVLTKPDRIDNASRYQEVRKALNGDIDQLGYGYFVVKQPSQEAIDRNISHHDARVEEEGFFDQQQPWANNNFAVHRNRFGTRNLQAALSDKLAALSLQSLPETKHEIDQRLSQIDSELAKIPKPPVQDVIGIVRDLLSEFTTNVSKEMLRKGTNNHWRLTWDLIRQDFAERLEAKRPKLQIEGSHDRPSLQSNIPEAIDLISEDSDDPAQSSSLPITPHKRKLGRLSPMTPTGTSSTSNNGTPHLSKKPRIEISEDAIRYNLDQTRARLYQMSSAKFSLQVNPKAVERLSLESISKHWQALLERFFSDLHKGLTDRLASLLEQSFTKWRTTSLFHECSTIVNQFFSLHFDMQRTTIAPDVLMDELSGPYLFDSPYWQIHLDRFTSEYKASRLKKRTDIYFKLLKEHNGKDISPKEREAQAKKDPLKTKLAEDPYAQEVLVIAQVRSYYELASIRFREAICMRIESRLFKTLSDDLLKELKDGLDIVDENAHKRCVQLLADDPQREARRQELERKKADLLAGQKCLDNLFNKYKNDAIFNPNGNELYMHDVGNPGEDGDQEMV